MGTNANANPFASNDVRGATIKLWMLVTSRPDLFTGKVPNDFTSPNPLPSELNQVATMIVDQAGTPAQFWVDRVRSVCQSAVIDPNNPGAVNGFVAVRQRFQAVCADGCLGVAGEHPSAAEFTVTMNT